MVSEREEDNITGQLAEIVGPENVVNRPDIVKSFTESHSFVQPVKPRLVVRPASAGEVQKIVQWANETLVPLVPVSSGPPHFCGGTVPGVSGTVVMNLRRMQKIMHVDRKNRMILIEPGVSYEQLQPVLAAEGLRVSTPLLPRGNKSVITSLLERQPTLVPKYNWSLPEPLRCLEIVWGRGETLWTGEAGSAVHSLEKQWARGLAQIDPKGPLETDWYRLVSGAQGSMGVVTWASIKCELLPRAHRLFFIPADNLDNLIDSARRLLRLRLGDEFLLVNNLTLACIIGRDTAEIEMLREKLPSWSILVGVAGRDILPEERVEVQEQDIRETCRQYGNSPVASISGIEGEQVLDTLLRPSEEPYWKLKYRGEYRDIFFMTTLDRTPEFVKLVYSLAESVNWPASRIGVYIQPQHQGVSHHCEFSLYYDPANTAEAAGARKLFDLVSTALAEQGAFFSRPYGSWADLAYRRDPQAAALLKDVKKILDPRNILNPGKLCFPAREV
ncbi:MAG: FAD-binding oxidoreductase [Dehalococcoidales bacterium]|nr:FAD-binding oxidoreductase [Dehalococcoidales bacterium]